MFGWVVDFYCPAKKLIVEVDGKYHERRRREDAQRDRTMNRHGFRVLRLSNDAVRTHVDRVVATIAEYALEPDQLAL